ncbi:AAEL013847-PA, partial [Aedes aegypti]
DDGMIEVVGLTTYQLPLLQAGGHGTCIAQCKSAKIVTSKTIPMQVDGEACKLKPSTIELTLLNKAVMLAKRKPGRANVPQEKLESLNLPLMKIMMSDYEQHHYDKDLLKNSAVNLGTLDVPVTDLEQVRVLVNKHCEEQPDSPKLSPDWCFIDSCTAERFFRVDRAQENLHFITDIATDCIFVLDQECPTLPQTPEDESGEGRIGPAGASHQQRRVQRSGVSRRNAAIARVKVFQPLKDLHMQGYSLLSIDSSGQTALHYAARYGHKDIVRYLISYAPNSIVNMIDNET